MSLQTIWFLETKVLKGNFGPLRWLLLVTQLQSLKVLLSIIIMYEGKKKPPASISLKLSA